MLAKLFKSDFVNPNVINIFTDDFSLIKFFQIEEVLLTKIDSSPAQEYVELYAGVAGEEPKCYL